jgi:hypothetical protein
MVHSTALKLHEIKDWFDVFLIFTDEALDHEKLETVTEEALFRWADEDDLGSGQGNAVP